MIRWPTLKGRVAYFGQYRGWVLTPFHKDLK